METIIYLIRHSEQLRVEEANWTKDVDQIKNEKIILSVKGEKQAEALSKNKELQNIDLVWSSNYVRAKETAKYIAQQNGQVMNISEDFNERKLGNIETLKKLGETKQYSYTTEQMLDENLKNRDGESRKEVHHRMKKAMEKLVNNNPGKRIAIVGHGAAMKYLLMEWCTLNQDKELTYHDQVLSIDSPCIIKMTFEDGQAKEIKQILTD